MISATILFVSSFFGSLLCNTTFDGTLLCRDFLLLSDEDLGRSDTEKANLLPESKTGSLLEDFVTCMRGNGTDIGLP